MKSFPLVNLRAGGGEEEKAKRTNFSTCFNRDKSFYTPWRKFRDVDLLLHIQVEINSR